MNFDDRRAAIRRVSSLWNVADRYNLTINEWVAEERRNWAAAANTVANEYGVPGRVTVADVEATEPLTVGHFDYQSKTALHLWELIEERSVDVPS